MSAQRLSSSSGWPSGSSGSPVKYLNIPLAESHLEDIEEESRRQRNSSRFFNRIVGSVVSFTAVCVIVLVVVLHYHPFHPSHHGSDETCYVAPSCTSINHRWDENGFTNLTGWPATACESSLSDVGPYCCDICVDAPTSEISPASLSTAAEAVTYNYLLMDQIWLPQLCNALVSGHDPTVTHLKGSLCVTDVLQSEPRLTIHGLWPNLFNAATSVCCSTDQDTPYSPLIPSLVQQWPIYKQLKVSWMDPTTDSIQGGLSCATCYMLNHEWQKHGTCMGAMYPTEDEVELQIAYFTAGLELHTRMHSNSTALAAMAGQTVSSASIAALYDKQVNVMCDPQALPPTSRNTRASSSGSGNGDAESGPLRPLRGSASAAVGLALQDEDVGVFLEVQTCWNMTSSADPQNLEEGSRGLQAEMTMIDCPPPISNSFTAPCPAMAYVSLFPTTEQ